TLGKTLTGIDPDRLPEEKERGLTIDLGFAPFILDDGRRVGIVDVPGHERFVKNMVAGATGIDLVMLVIAADDGIMPQTREHLNIMSLLGIRRGLVVLTKIDMVEREFVDLVTEDIRELVRGTFLEGAPILPVSSTTGAGIDVLKKTLNTMILETSPHRGGGIFRMPVQRVFSARGFGTIVTGIPVSGSLRIGDTVEILPLGKTGRVRGLQAYKSDVAEIRAGHSSAVNIADIDHAQVKRGDVAAAPGYYEASRFVECRFRYLPELKKKLRDRTPVRIHAGTAEAVGLIVLLDKKALEPGEEGIVQIRTEEPVVVGAGDAYVLRLPSPAVTIGGGRVLASSNVKRRRFYEETNAMLAECAESLGRGGDQIEFVLKHAGPRMIDQRTAAILAKTPTAETEAAIRALQTAGKIITHPSGKFIHETSFAVAKRRIAEAVGRFHAANPLRLGIDHTSLHQQAGIESDLFTLALGSLVAAGEAIDEHGIVRLASFKVNLDDRDAELAAGVERIFRETKLQTPRREDLPAMTKARPEKIDRVLKLLVEMGKIALLKEGVILHRETLDEARRKLIDVLQRDGTIEAGKFRELLGTSRKYIIPMLEHFDSEGVTVRDGNVRKLKQPCRK
ncbi:MAG: selenocysteine-specific translation elongation factor, partial [Planctomycetes bacterium RBG_16_59_8]